MFAIIGAGNVVARRLLPALTYHGLDLKDVEVHGTPGDPEVLNVAGTLVPVTRHEVEDLPRVVADTSLIPWLATPPFNGRRELLEALSGRRDPRGVCEKPLGMSREDYLWLDSNPDVLNDVFVLSYYVQEKFAPALWLTGRLSPPASLISTGLLPEFTPQPEVEITGIDLILSEPLIRALGDTVTSWCSQASGPAGQVLEFAVHAPALLRAFGFNEVKLDPVLDPSRVTLSGPNLTALVSRPGPLVRTLQANTSEGLLLADASTRSASLDGKALALTEACPPYVPLVAYVLDWLAGATYSGDKLGQLNALRVLT